MTQFCSQKLFMESQKYSMNCWENITLKSGVLTSDLLDIQESSAVKSMRSTEQRITQQVSI